MKCPKCAGEVLSQNINIQTDVAQCHHCNAIFRISENLERINEDGFDLKSPPAGAWVRNDINKIVIGATTRSPIAFFLVPFMVVWSGGSIGTIYGGQLMRGEFDAFSSLFGIPFLLGSVVLWSLALMAIWGKVELTLDQQGGSIFTGLGQIGLTKKFSWEEVSTVKEEQTLMRYPGSQGHAIVLEGKRKISFGQGIREGRRYYLFRAMKTLMTKMKANYTLPSL
jgi:hypothetical protein